MREQNSSQRTRQIIAPILTETYGKGGMVDALADHLAEKIDGVIVDDGYAYRSREHMIKLTCWNWFSGGGTAEGVARKIEAAL